MSYSLIRKIQVKDNQVYITAACNNIRPRHYSESVCSYASKILQEQGAEAFDLDMLKAYESGEFQRGKNKYSRALEILRHDPEYKAFDWRRSMDDDNTDKRKSPEFIALLKKAMVAKLPRDKFIVKKDYFGAVVYLEKVTRRSAMWTREKIKAKIYRWKEDADFMKKCFTNSEAWETEQIA